MLTRHLGLNGFRASEVGLGCWQFGGDFGPVAEKTAMEIMEAAVSGGITFFDTANVYGDGRSEKLIGRFLQQQPAGITVATKFGRGEVYPDNYSEKALNESVDAARRRLGVDVLDLLQLHCIPIGVLQEGAVFDWLRKLKDRGAIRHFGASVETVEEGLLCLQQDGLLSLQVIFNICRQKPAATLLPEAEKAGVGIIVRLPLASGLLSGKFNQKTTFAETDHRNYNRDGAYFNVGETFAGLPFETGVALADAMKAYVPQGISMAQMALRWILDHKSVSVVIPGASSEDQARANAAVSGLAPLPPDLHRKLSDFYRDRIHDHIRGPY